MKKYSFIAFLLLSSCAGYSRSCAADNAERFGADWIVIKESLTTGEPVRCWKLEDVSITNEHQSDGIYWENSDGNLVHISGNYDRIQVTSKQWEKAAVSLGVDLNKCKNGEYK